MAGKKVAALTAEDPPKLVARAVSRALGLEKELGRDALPKDVLAAARKQMPKVAIPRGTLPKDALLLIAGAISAQQQAQEAAEAKKRREQKRAKAQRGAMGELPPSDSDEDEYEYADEVGEEPAPEPELAAQFTTDKRGNSISVAEAERRKAEQAEREAAAARRAAKAAAAAEPPKSEAATLAEQLATARAKAAAGEKLGMRDKKLLKKYGRDAPEPEPEPEPDDGLGAFELRLAGGASEPDAAESEGRDISIRDFSIHAPGLPLFISANLHLAAGKRYGLLGPNGRGKTTLLRFLASGRMPLPPRTSCLLVEQEVAPSQEPVVQQVRISAH